MLSLHEKHQALRRLLESYGSCLVAYSGGVDSVFLARAARDVLGDRALAVIADSPSLPRRELAEAVAVAERFAIPLRVVRTAEFENPQYLANPTDRCYFCKQELFIELEPIARQEGFAVIAYGENASDLAVDRPGGRAAAEFQVRAPLKEAGLTKADIRALSAELGLPTADKPQMACLSSRLPTGERVTPEKLAWVERAENVLRDLGFHDVRVRHHSLGNLLPGAGLGAPTAPLQVPQPRSSRRESAPVRLPEGEPPLSPDVQDPHKSAPLNVEVPPGPGPALARIEVGPGEMARFFEGDTAARVAAALREIGYAHVTLDLVGYRRAEVH